MDILNAENLRKWQDNLEKSWEDFFARMMEAEPSASASNGWLKVCLGYLGFLRQETEKSLEIMNFPTRKDLARISTEILDLSDRLNLIEEKLEKALDLLQRKGAQGDAIKKKGGRDNAGRYKDKRPVV